MVRTARRPVLLARHGETDYNAAGRFQGSFDPPLNARGREQAAALGAALAAGGDPVAGGVARVGHEGVDLGEPVGAVSVIWASPYLRARQTAEIVAEALGLPIRFDDRLKETDVGEWSGFTYSEVQAQDAAAFQAWVEGDPKHVFPGGESLALVAARVAEVVAEARAAGGTVLCVCHGGVIRSALRAAGHPVHEPGAAMNGETVAV